MELLEIKTATITEKGQIAIPKEIRKKWNVQKGQKVAILSFSDHIEIKPMPKAKIDKEELGWTRLAEESWGKEWNTPEEDEAWKDL